MSYALNKPNDVLIGPPDIELNDSSLLAFWQWAYGDLCDDDIKGHFAEWLVHKLLKTESTRRISWANSDVVVSLPGNTSVDVRIEVKATAYWQSWKVINEKGLPYPEPVYPMTPEHRIQFGGLTARTSITVPDLSKPKAYKSDIYIFAFQHEKELARWNAMDLSQWEFYLLLADDLKRIGTRSISLQKLQSLQSGPLSASAFVARAQDAISSIAGLHSFRLTRPALDGAAG